MSKFPVQGEAIVAEATGSFCLVVGISEASARVVAQGLARGDFTKADLADGIENAAVMLTMPGRISRALTTPAAGGAE